MFNLKHQPQNNYVMISEKETRFNPKFPTKKLKPIESAFETALKNDQLPELISAVTINNREFILLHYGNRILVDDYELTEENENNIQFSPLPDGRITLLAKEKVAKDFKDENQIISEYKKTDEYKCDLESGLLENEKDVKYYALEWKKNEVYSSKTPEEKSALRSEVIHENELYSISFKNGMYYLKDGENEIELDSRTLVSVSKEGSFNKFFDKMSEGRFSEKVEQNKSTSKNPITQILAGKIGKHLSKFSEYKQAIDVLKDIDKTKTQNQSKEDNERNS